MNAAHTPQADLPRVCKRVVLASRPIGKPALENFRLEEVALPTLPDGQVLIRNRYLSIDPYMLGRMYEARSYAAAQALDEVMVGEAVGHVVLSCHPDFKIGDAVVGPTGWQEYAVSDTTRLRRVEDDGTPLSAYLGALGMTGVTAWVGMTQICQPKAGETVVVSAAAGAVGSVAVALAKAQGCRVIGIAGGAHKARHVIHELGADDCIDYRTVDSAAALTRLLSTAAPDGVDAFFDNVNGWILDGVLPAMSLYGRIALCGLISRFGDKPMSLTNHQYMLFSRLKAQGFIVWDHDEHWNQAVDHLRSMLDQGSLHMKETLSQGIESAPAACLGLMNGHNLGKQIVQLY